VFSFFLRFRRPNLIITVLTGVWGSGPENKQFVSPVREGRYRPSINRVCKMSKYALELHRKETYKSIDLMSIPPKFSVGNSFNKMEKLDHQLLEIWVSCRCLNKRGLWRTMIGKLKVLETNLIESWMVGILVNFKFKLNPNLDLNLYREIQRNSNSTKISIRICTGRYREIWVSRFWPVD